ncbi:Sodium/hydrogen exchanger family-domain-containing protein [Cladorrhinum samala]|uniref:Sodium/hydrogen exchanger family-domain-containing protein n=1 Tax=Cladorrhinum samala TaxID=585594 RepID=A0AAV9HN28_9PEZI|nr:Sodium/hydrogen exchanger family-domain-containing protein [Cladorrhinum samala]
MWVLRRTKSLENGPTEGVVALTVLMVLASSFFTNVIGVHSIFGAFMVGLICPHEGGFAIKLTEKIEDLTATLFVPLFFALSGLNTNIGLLDSGKVWAYVFAIIFVAFFSKLAGGTIGARMNGLVWRESLTIGTLMSCKGLVELIVLNIGLQAKILSTRTFTMFVIMALVTTFVTTPLTTWLYPPWYQQKLELWKKGKIDWEGNPILPADGEELEDKYRQGDAATRLLVYLRTDGLSSVLGLVSLFTSAFPPADRRGNGESEKAPQLETRPLRIQGYRLVPLTDRNSSVMKVSDIEDHASHDPIVKAFGTSTANNTARDVIVSGQIAVVPEESYADTLATQAGRLNSDLILIPWSETGSVSEGQNHYYYTSAGGLKGSDGLLENKEFAELVGQVYEKSRYLTGVGVFVDKGVFEAQNAKAEDNVGNKTAAGSIARQLTRDATGVSLAETQDLGAARFHSADGRGDKVVRVMYKGGEDDLFAVRLGFQFAQSGKVGLEVVVDASSLELGTTRYEFGLLKTVMEQSLGERVTFTDVKGLAESVEKLLEPSSATSASSSVLVIVGRSVPAASPTHQSSSGASSSSESAVGKVLGSVTSRLAAEVRKETPGSKAKISVLVVQSRSTAPATAEAGKPTLTRKASTCSRESDGE